MHRASAAFAMATLSLLSACGSGGAIAPPAAASDAGIYRLGSGDQLRVIVYGEDKLTAEYHVGDDGSVTMPLIGSVKAVGLTTPEFAEKVTAAFKDGGYLTTPRVAAEVLNYRPFFILGEVNKPGQYPFIPGLTVSQAIATAGGYTYRARKSVVQIIHRDKMDAERFALDPGRAMAVTPGDTITIPERHF